MTPANQLAHEQRMAELSEASRLGTAAVDAASAIYNSNAIATKEEDSLAILALRSLRDVLASINARLAAEKAKGM